MFHDHPITAAITDVLSVESEQGKQQAIPTL